jgi:stearoyl-CoA desaturase (Delta-9 desaturase)
MNLILYTLVVTHITILSVTLYLHRSQAHRGVEFHPVIAHFFRFWLWLTTGMITRQWVAIHRKHHQHSDQPGDPHSPHVHGIWNILFRGVYYYYVAAKDARMTLSYGRGTPDDWIERNIYSRHSSLGVTLMGIINLALFGPWGLVILLIQILWIPFWAAGVINGLGHWIGYRNGTTRDQSRNMIPWAFWIGGEELHNNHHLAPASPRLSLRWWEFDEGWMWIKLLSLVGLAKIRTLDTVQAESA